MSEIAVTEELAELDAMVRESLAPKVRDWFVNYVVKKNPDGLDLAGLLDVVAAEMKDAPDRLQREMNNTLAYIGIEHAEHRERALEIGERLKVLNLDPPAELRLKRRVKPRMPLGSGKIELT